VVEVRKVLGEIAKASTLERRVDAATRRASRRVMLVKRDLWVLIAIVLVKF
jgi:hypothetical protein